MTIFYSLTALKIIIFLFTCLFILFQNNGKEANQLVLTKLRCAAGLAELATRKYKSAAKNFLQASFDHCDFPDVSIILAIYIVFMHQVILIF